MVNKMNNKRKKVKIKKKRILLLIILVILSFLIIKINNLNNKQNTSKEKIIEKEEKPKDEFEIIKEQIDYYNDEYTSRYKTYKESNPTLDITQIIKNVNMQLDKNYYEDPIPARNINTEKVLVNKHYYLESNYIPNNLEAINQSYALSGMKLVKEAREAFELLSETAKKENYRIIAMSSYRSYDYQVQLYNRYKEQDGEEKANTYSGKPGHSEHQTGLAVDVYNGKENYTNFESTKEFNWMQEHAHEFGFILRFPKEKVSETGYQYESWHYRYVGIEAATYIKNNNISFEEYYATKIKDW